LFQGWAPMGAGRAPSAAERRREAAVTGWSLYQGKKLRQKAEPGKSPTRPATPAASRASAEAKEAKRSGKWGLYLRCLKWDSE
jgi:hypothetical protein